MSLNQKNNLMVFSNKFHDLLSCKAIPNHLKKMEVLGRSFHIKYILMTKYRIFHCKVDLSTLKDLHNTAYQFAYYKAPLKISSKRSYRLILRFHHVKKYLQSKFYRLTTLISRCNILWPCKHLSPYVTEIRSFQISYS